MGEGGDCTLFTINGDRKRREKSGGYLGCIRWKISEGIEEEITEKENHEVRERDGRWDIYRRSCGSFP